MKKALDLPAVLLLTVLCGSWGLAQTATKVTLWGIPPAMQVGGRSLVAALLVFLWCLVRGKPLFERDGTLMPGLIVGALFGLEFLLLFAGLSYTTASRAVVFLYLAPFVVAVGAHFSLGEHLTRLTVTGLAAAFLGVMAAFSDSLFLPPAGDVLLGDALCIAAAIAWGASIVIIKGSALARASAEKTLLYQLAVSAVLGLLAAWALGETLQPRLALAVLPAFLYQAVWVATITYIAWFALIRKYPASLLSSFTFLTPLFGVAFGTAVLNDPLTPNFVFALLLVGIGLYLVNRRGLPAAGAA